jgi:cytochrome b6-f complex iron-sulfur subunit
MVEHKDYYNRRRFLMVVGQSAIAVPIGCSDPGGVGPEPIGDVAAGNVADLPESSLRAVGSVPVAIGRDSQGVYALTLTCSHEGCNMAVEGTVAFTGIWCACHGARFSANGEVRGGPAPDPLVHFAVEIDAVGDMTIHGDQRVDATVRTPVI